MQIPFERTKDSFGRVKPGRAFPRENGRGTPYALDPDMTALALAASLFLSQANPPPFPPPHHTQLTATLRCDWGSVAQVDASGGRLLVQTTIGVITYLVSANDPVYGPDGLGSGTVSGLRTGQPVHVYFHFAGDGARVDEIDLDPPSR
jgi:hypothetical protein